MPIYDPFDLLADFDIFAKILTKEIWTTTSYVNLYFYESKDKNK